MWVVTWRTNKDVCVCVCVDVCVCVPVCLCLPSKLDSTTTHLGCRWTPCREGRERQGERTALKFVDGCLCRYEQVASWFYHAAGCSRA